MFQKPIATPLVFALMLPLTVSCGGDDSDDSSTQDEEDTTGEPDGGDEDPDGSGGGDTKGSGEIAFTVTLIEGDVELPPLTGSFVLGNDDGALRYTVNLSGTSGGGSIALRREGEEPWEPGTYTPELLSVTWNDESVTCSFSEGNLDGRMLTVELEQLDPVIGTFDGEATCTTDDGSFTGTISGTFDDS